MGATEESRKTRIDVSIQEVKGLFRDGLERILAEAGELRIVAEAGHGGQDAGVPAPAVPDVVLVDASMPGVDGADAARRAKRHSSKAKVLLITATDEEESIHEILHAGAAGCLTKASTPEDLVRAIKAVAAGEPFFPPAVSRALVQGYLRKHPAAHAPRSRFDTLSAREREVLTLIAEGRRNKETAARLGISVKTVEVHRAHVMVKLEIHNVADLVKLAIKKGLVTLG